MSISKELVDTRIGLLFMTEVTVGVFKDVKRQENTFSLMADRCKKQGIEFSNLHAYDIGGVIMCNALNLSPKLRIMALLQEKMPELFTYANQYMINLAPERLIENDFRTIKGVDECTESEEMYKCCNSQTIRTRNNQLDNPRNGTLITITTSNTKEAASAKAAACIHAARSES